MAREARFVDGHELPEQSVLFLGMSMKTQIKLKGEYLKAVAEIYTKSSAKFKYVYLCDSVHAMNISSSQIISIALANNTITDQMLNAVAPDFHLTEVTRDGDDWLLEHEDKFKCPNHSGIIRHSAIRKHEGFPASFRDACNLYCKAENQEFFDDLNAIVAQVLGRNLSKKDKILEKIRAVEYIGEGRLNDTTDPLNKATLWYIEVLSKQLTDSKLATNAGIVVEDLQNPIIQELIKNSLRYVLEELAGKRLVITEKILPELGAANAKLPFYYVYPGILDVVNSFFQLVSNIYMLVKPLKIRKSNPASEENSSEETFSSSPPKDFDQKVIEGYFNAIQTARSNASECKVKPEDVAELILAMERKKSPGSSPKASPKRKAQKIAPPPTNLQVLRGQTEMFRKPSDSDCRYPETTQRTNHTEKDDAIPYPLNSTGIATASSH